MPHSTAMVLGLRLSCVCLARAITDTTVVVIVSDVCEDVSAYLYTKTNHTIVYHITMLRCVLYHGTFIT